MVGQIGESDCPLEVATMTVKIAGDDQLARGRQMNQIAVPKRILAVRLGSLIQQINY
jgi:hypothetical protein